MRSARFHHALYGGPALDEAVGVYAPFAELVRTEESPYWVVSVTAADPGRERRLLGELANYALGLTVKQRSGGGKP